MNNDLPMPQQLTFDEELAEIKPYYLVNQANDLINSRQDLSLTERRIIYSLISLVQPEDEEMKTYVLQIKDLARLVGISEHSFYERVEKSIDQLQSKVLVVEKFDTQGNPLIVDKINWIQQATYLKGEGLVRIKLSDALAQYLVNLKTSYTKYRLYNVLKLKSEYSWRMYEILKEREPLQRKRILRVSELRRLLNIPDDKLTQTKNLKKVVIEKAKEELKEKTDIYFEYEVHKKIGRRIDSFVFYVYKNEQNVRQFLSKDAVDFDVRAVLSRIMKYGVSKSVAVSWIKQYHPRYIEENLDYAVGMQSHSGSIDNLSGYIYQTMKHNYAESVYSYEGDEYESSLYGMAAGDYVHKVKAKTDEDISRIKDLLSRYSNAILKTSDDLEALQQLGKERKQQLINLINDINESRMKHGYPYLSQSDFNDHQELLPYYNEWEKVSASVSVEKDEIPY
ncbi:replication initiation protein [Bacillus velezensis]|uniref:replication initiation protein n=1 Tax=Bacillus velezensis TaxID=492670 RepID=UPI0021B10A20|nr:replication initiation protein [Bacillus velezensis]MCT6684619.1 replication initiation protein [Bacillus velezensis]